MSKNIAAAIFGMIIFLLLDITKPLSYIIYVDFLLIGVIILSQYYPFLIAFILSLLFGYFKDCLIGNGHHHFYLFLLPLIVIFFYYGLKFLAKKPWVLVVSTFVIYGFIYNIIIVPVPLIYRLLFLLHSFLMYWLITYLLSKWLKNLSINYI